MRRKQQTPAIEQRRPVELGLAFEHIEHPRDEVGSSQRARGHDRAAAGVDQQLGSGQPRSIAIDEAQGRIEPTRGQRDMQADDRAALPQLVELEPGLARVATASFMRIAAEHLLEPSQPTQQRDQARTDLANPDHADRPASDRLGQTRKHAQERDHHPLGDRLSVAAGRVGEVDPTPSERGVIDMIAASRRSPNEAQRRRAREQALVDARDAANDQRLGLAQRRGPRHERATRQPHELAETSEGRLGLRDRVVDDDPHQRPSGSARAKRATPRASSASSQRAKPIRKRERGRRRNS